MTQVNIEDELLSIGELVWVYGGDVGITLAERLDDGDSQTWSIINEPFFMRDEDRIIVDTYFDDLSPTHWHSLPKLPKLQQLYLMKPDWKDAPEWANYLAQDESGDWYWYENKPCRDYYEWKLGSDNGKVEEAGRLYWKESLEQRPKH